MTASDSATHTARFGTLSTGGAWDRLAERGVAEELVGSLQKRCETVVPRLADTEMAMRNLESFFTAARDPHAIAALFERDRDALPNLLQLLATSQYVADQLVRDQECYELVREAEGRPTTGIALTASLLTQIDEQADWDQVSALLRQAKRRETARIAYGDIIRGQSVATVAEQISHLADAIVEAALYFNTKRLNERFGIPLRRDGERCCFCVLALGKLGGAELNYSSDIDLIFVYEEDGHTDHPRETTNREYFENLSRDVVRLIGEASEHGPGYRVDLRLRPEGDRGRICLPLDQTIAYYDTRGRTWERQAFIKARAIAGDLAVGDTLLETLEPWVYRTYLSTADIAGIKTLKRTIEKRSTDEGEASSNVKTGNGGIRDIEFVIQFLQLVNGGALPDVRTGNTLLAIEQLEKTGCLTPQERSHLSDNYAFLRKLEHRLQLVFDQQTHTLPGEEEELRKVAIRMGFEEADGQSALEAFRVDYRRRTEVNRQILDHLLHDAFEEPDDEAPEADLINDPNPSGELIEQVLGRYPLTNHESSYTNLMSLATERLRFLSTRRCRHFFASIAPRILAAVAKTPEPDQTLVNMSRVSDSLGGKAALWELLSSNETALDLYVRLCAACPYLAEILTSNPGMIDELMDGLLVGRLPSSERLVTEVAELTRGAEDLDPILHSFKNAYHLSVGVRDILGWDDVRATHRALADVAEACLGAIGSHEYSELLHKFGTPTIGPLDELDDDASAEAIEEYRALHAREGRPAGMVILAMGKLGGREPNYHSDLDLIFLYEAEGPTVHSRRSRRAVATTNGHFFSELGQRVITAANRLTPHGRLYEVDTRLRPTGGNGSLAVSVRAFREYFASGSGQLWERLALCKARAVHGTPEARKRVMAAVTTAAYGPGWEPEHADRLRDMRRRLEETASPRNLKRGPGGTVDTEFLVQMLQLKHGGSDGSIRVPGTLAALTALEAAGYLASEDAEFFRHSYGLQRSVESRVRLMASAGRHEFPTDSVEQRKLAFLLNRPDAETLSEEVESCRRETRVRFDRLFKAARA